MIFSALRGAMVIVADIGAWNATEVVMSVEGVGELIRMRSSAVTRSPFVCESA